MSDATPNNAQPSPRRKRGEVREDGKIFHHYYRSNGRSVEYWVSPEKFESIRLNDLAAKKRWYNSLPEEAKSALLREKYEQFKDSPARIAVQKSCASKWRKRNREHLNAKHKEKRNNDPVFAVAHRCRRMTAFAFTRKGFKKNGFSEQILGCTWEELKVHIEKQFQPGMDWSSRSLWHVDHKIPIAAAASPEDVIRLCHYTNLQPLWILDNLKKADKLDPPFQLSEQTGCKSLLDADTASCNRLSLCKYFDSAARTETRTKGSRNR